MMVEDAPGEQEHRMKMHALLDLVETPISDVAYPTLGILSDHIDSVATKDSVTKKVLSLELYKVRNLLTTFLQNEVAANVPQMRRPTAPQMSVPPLTLSHHSPSNAQLAMRILKYLQEVHSWNCILKAASALDHFLEGTQPRNYFCIHPFSLESSVNRYTKKLLHSH